jgi:hypothetical protein
MKTTVTIIILLFFGSMLKAQQTNHKGWTKFYETVDFMAIYKSPVLRSSSDKTRRYYCECYVKGLKETYPNGIAHNVPFGVQDSIAKTCMKLIKANTSLLGN